MLYLVIMLVMVSREMMTGAGIFVTFPVDTVENGRLVTVTGEVFRIDETEEYQTLYLKRVGISDGRQNIQERYFLAYVKGNHSFALGNKIKASGSLEFFENERNPGAFSRKKYYRTQGIPACIWTEKTESVSKDIDPFRERLRLLRKRWSEAVLQILGAKKGGILNAMLLGDKQQMDVEIKEQYQVNGIAHILAISGVKTLKLDIPLVPETRIKWALMPLHIAKIYILKLCLDEEIIPRCRFPCSRGYLTKCINQQKKQ